MHDVTQLLEAINRGDAVAANQLYELFYQELRQYAGKELARWQPGQSYSATALVNEYWVRLKIGDALADERRYWNNRKHFCLAAARAMRNILLERARHHQAAIHGGGRQREELAPDLAAADAPSRAVLNLHEALERFQLEYPDHAQLVELCYFYGNTREEAAEMLGIDRRTAQRWWKFARAWLKDDLGDREATAR